MDLLPGYQWVPNPNLGNNDYVGNAGNPCILLHQIVGNSFSISYAQSHTVPPQCWASPYDGKKVQTGYLEKPGKALYQPQYGYAYTNRKPYTIQTELAGTPIVSEATYTLDECKWIGANVIAPQAQWLLDHGIPIDLNQIKYHSNTSGSASVSWPYRMSESEWVNFNGVCAHIDCWGNDHWDCSAERIDWMVDHAKQILGTNGNPAPKSKVEVLDFMYRWVVDETGTQYAVFGTKAWPMSSAYAIMVMQKAGCLMTKQQMIDAGFEWNIDRGSMAAAFEIQPISNTIPDNPF